MAYRDPGSYRSGLTLGLTMAEIFMLILFLMLFIALALYIYNDEKDGELKTALKELKELQDAKQELEKTLEESKEELPEDIVEIGEKEDTSPTSGRHKSKGIDPPCWYEVVEREDKRHEKPHYLADIAVHNKYLIVRLHWPPRGRAIDEDGTKASRTYAEEYQSLPLPSLDSAKEKRLSLKQFQNLFGPVRAMGKQGQIRDYPCVFYARVWDNTSKNAKRRWKNASKTIKQAFYIYEVQNDPWALEHGEHSK